MTGRSWRAAPIVTLFALCSCGALELEQIKRCEQALTNKLKSPASYKRVSAHSLLMESVSPPEVWVTIEYDAVNSFNAPLRGTETCKYPANSQGDVDWPAYDKKISDDADRIVRESNDAMKEVQQATAAAAKDAERSAYPYVTPDGVDIRSAADEANWRKYGTTDPNGGE